LLNSRFVVAADALPAGSRIASFEIEAVIARGPSSFVYLAQDLTRGMPVAIKEYAPARHIGAAANEAVDPLVQRGLQAFMAEARMLAACHHPSLVRVEALLDANRTAYRVMPFYKGLSLVHLRTGLGRAPDDATLRAWGADLVGALQTMHDTGHAHGGVSPENIMLLADDRPLLFGAGSASHRVGSNLVESLLADFGLGSAAAKNGEPDPKLVSAAATGTVIHDEPAISVAPPEAVADDMRALAAVLRFCISGDVISPTPGSDTAAPLISGIAGASVPPLPPAPPARPEASAALPVPSRVLAEQANLEGLEQASSSALTEPEREPNRNPDHDPEHAPQPEAWFAAAPIAIPPAVTGRPLIPERWHIPLWVGLIALVGVGVLAAMGYVMGAWNRMPPIDFDRSVQAAPVLAPAAASASASSEPPSPNPAPALPATAPLLASSRDVASAGLPAVSRPVIKAPGQTLPTKLTKKATKKAPLKRPVRRALPAAAAKGVGPLAACGQRTNFALERCMQIQCQNKRWASHPQCTSRRAG
jgi:serine/threonine protein kinase